MLPKAFIAAPIAHRALHGLEQNCPENSRAAIRAAIQRGYGIEIDLQLSADGRAMVFHDDRLDRLTQVSGRVTAHTAAELAEIPLRGGDGECVPTLQEVLEIVAGQVPLLIEIKDQDGAMGPRVGTLEAATIKDLEGYAGTVALMSFNPHSIAEVARLAPHMPRGLITSAYDTANWPELPQARCDELRDIPDFDRVGACFISHQASDVTRARVQDIRATGTAVLTWTVKSLEQEAQLRAFVDNVTFEQYLSPHPA